MTLAELQSRTDRVDGFYNALIDRRASLGNEIRMQKEEMDLLTKTSHVLKHLLDVMVKGEITKMAGLMTYGLKSVFDDQNLTFLPVLSRKNDKVNIELKTVNKDIEGEFGSFGGSVAVIESFLLRIICILKMDLARVILMDETFNAVSAEYRMNTSKLIGELSKKLGIDVLLVTHEKEFPEFADHVYRVKEASTGLVMEKVK